MLRSAGFIVRSLNVLNWVLGAAFVLLLVLTFAFEGRITATLATQYPEGQAGTLLRDGRLVLLVGLAGWAPARLLFVRLTAILRTVETGDAFIVENGERLRAIGWALLALQVLDLAYGWLALNVSAATGEYFGWSFSIAGWLSILLVFVLAQIWTQGAAMRDELNATV